MLLATDPLEPVVDRVGRDRRGQRAKVVWRRAGDSRELAETPVRQSGGAARGLMEHEGLADRVGPELSGFDRLLCDATAPSASRLVERVDAGVPFVGWA